MKETAIIYYSLANGNTYSIARRIQQQAGGRLIRIETVRPYMGSYDNIVAAGQEEVNRLYCPPLQPVDIRWDDIGTVILGTPTWWYTMAPAMRTFLTEHDFHGKVVIPFVTNGGWTGHVMEDIASLIPGSLIRCPLTVTFDVAGKGTIEQSTPDLSEWLQQVRHVVAPASSGYPSVI